MTSGRNFKKDSAKDPRGGHARLYWEILDGNAWRSLAAADQRAYIALQRQLRSTNNGDLSLPLTFARHYGITSPATLAKSLRALVAVGLLAVTRKGGSTKGGQRQPTLYRFTDHQAYDNPAKLIEGSKPTNEWKAVKTIAHGICLIREAEDAAAAMHGKKLKSLLQKLAHTASKIEVVVPNTASEIEVWTPPPTSKIEAGEKSQTVCKANAGAGFKKSDDIGDSENHTSKIEVLSTVAIPTANSKRSRLESLGLDDEWDRDMLACADGRSNGSSNATSFVAG